MAQPGSLSHTLQSLERLAPLSTAESWDNVGLLAGDPAAGITGAVVAVDLTREALETAIQSKSSLIITHHPAIFPKQKGIASLIHRGEAAEDSGSLLFRAVKHGISVYACHTNFDQCALEVSEQISKGLAVTPHGRILEKRRGGLLKLVVFVPEAHLNAVKHAVFEAGAGHIGQYDSCAFAVLGQGSFRGREGTNPFVGKPGELEETSEFRLETILPRGLERQVIEAMRKAHPYEEVAYDLMAVEQSVSAKGMPNGMGYGFWGDAAEPRSFDDWSARIKQTFEVNGFWATPAFGTGLGGKPRDIQRVAFTPGKGSSFISAVIEAKCGLYVTGEVGFHAAQDAARRGVTVVELGHRESELYFIKVMSSWIKDLGLNVHSVLTRAQGWV